MRIYGTYGQELPPILNRGRPDTSRAVGEANGESKSATDAEPAASTERSPVQVEYLERLRQIPEVRPERLKAIGRRLAGGEYLTREAAEKTAQAFLDLNDI